MLKPGTRIPIAGLHRASDPGLAVWFMDGRVVIEADELKSVSIAAEDVPKLVATLGEAAAFTIDSFSEFCSTLESNPAAAEHLGLSSTGDVLRDITAWARGYKLPEPTDLREAISRALKSWRSRAGAHLWEYLGLSQADCEDNVDRLREHLFEAIAPLVIHDSPATGESASTKVLAENVILAMLDQAANFACTYPYRSIPATSEELQKLAHKIAAALPPGPGPLSVAERDALAWARGRLASVRPHEELIGRHFRRLVDRLLNAEVSVRDDEYNHLDAIMAAAELEARTDWEQMEKEVADLIKRLQHKPVKAGFYVNPGSILNAYRSGDVPFDKAVRLLSDLPHGVKVSDGERELLRKVLSTAHDNSMDLMEEDEIEQAEGIVDRLLYPASVESPQASDQPHRTALEKLDDRVANLVESRLSKETLQRDLDAAARKVLSKPADDLAEAIQEHKQRTAENGRLVEIIEQMVRDTKTRLDHLERRLLHEQLTDEQLIEIYYQATSFTPKTDTEAAAITAQAVRDCIQAPTLRQAVTELVDAYGWGLVQIGDRHQVAQRIRAMAGKV